MDMARSLGHVDGGQEEALEALCRAAQAELAGRLRPEVRSEDCEDAFILACAWLALAGLAAGETGGGRFTAGGGHHSGGGRGGPGGRPPPPGRDGAGPLAGRPGVCLSGGTGMTGAWGRILARYGQSVTLRRGEEEQDCRAFLQPVRERREDWYQELPTPLGTARRDQWIYLGPPELPLEETNGLCVEWNGLRFAVRAAQPVCVGEETLYWWALLAVEDGEAQTEQT